MVDIILSKGHRRILEDLDRAMALVRQTTQARTPEDLIGELESIPHPLTGELPKVVCLRKGMGLWAVQVVYPDGQFQLQGTVLKEVLERLRLLLSSPAEG